MSLEQATFLRGMAQLTAAYPPRGGAEADQAALGTAWWRVLSAAEWLTGEVFDAAVQTTLEHVDDYLPTPATFLDICRQEARELAYEAQRAHAALPAPAHDPNATTPEERARWAREDQEIRPWAARLGLYAQPPQEPRFPVTPEVFERLSVADREALVAQHQANLMRANVPNLSPEARRARERRLAAERRQVAEVIAQARAAARARRNRWLAEQEAQGKPSPPEAPEPPARSTLGERAEVATMRIPAHVPPEGIWPTSQPQAAGRRPVDPQTGEILTDTGETEDGDGLPF